MALIEHDRAHPARFIAGVDEVGRGCLAGPLVACAVVLDTHTLVGPRAARLAALNDSKKLDAATREQLVATVLREAVTVASVSISATTIDANGLHKSNIAALTRALQHVAHAADHAFVDGFALDVDGLPTTRIVKGDATSVAIAAASVVAKVTRDAAMQSIDDLTERRWAFADHVGYATDLHRARIIEHGPGKWHRLSFASAAYDPWRAPDGTLVRVSEGAPEPFDSADATASGAGDERDIEAVPAGAAYE